MRPHKCNPPHHTTSKPEERSPERRAGAARSATARSQDKAPAPKPQPAQVEGRSPGRRAGAARLSEFRLRDYRLVRNSPRAKPALPPAGADRGTDAPSPNPPKRKSVACRMPGRGVSRFRRHKLLLHKLSRGRRRRTPLPGTRRADRRTDAPPGHPANGQEVRRRDLCV